MARVAVVFAAGVMSLSALADCGSRVPATNAGAPALSQPEYAVGSPGTMQVIDGETSRIIPYVRAGRHAIFEGDIVIGAADSSSEFEQLLPARMQASTLLLNAINKPFGLVERDVLSRKRIWDNNTVPYVIDPRLPGRDHILRSMQTWSNATKIVFVERTVANQARYRNYVHFMAGTVAGACLARGIGMIGGRQTVELVDTCGFGEVLHEIGHVLGLGHEQNRSDRDRYVRIAVENIRSGFAPQFDTRPAATQDLGAYDWDSIMHYQADAFTCNGAPTISPVTALPPGIVIGQRDHLSAGDRAAINLIYQ